METNFNFWAKWTVQRLHSSFQHSLDIPFLLRIFAVRMVGTRNSCLVQNEVRGQRWKNWNVLRQTEYKISTSVKNLAQARMITSNNNQLSDNEDLSFIGGLVWHHCIEVLSSDVSIIVKISFLENLVDLLIRKVFSQFSSHQLELLSVYFSLNKTLFTFLFKSNERKTSHTSSCVCSSPNRPVASFKKDSKVKPPTFSVSKSFRML